MLRFSRLILVALSLVLPAQAAPAGETKTVTAEGVAAFQQGELDIARNAAIEDAQKRAVEQAIGALIDSATQAENYQVISDRILSKAGGYITRYTVDGENRDSGLLRVRISADVDAARLSSDLSALGVPVGRMQTPGTRSVSIAITGLDRTQLVKFEDALRRRVSGITGLHEQGFSNGVARISVDSTTGVRELSDELSLRDFGPFSVQVTGSTASSLELRVSPK